MCNTCDVIARVHGWLSCPWNHFEVVFSFCGPWKAQEGHESFLPWEKILIMVILAFAFSMNNIIEVRHATCIYPLNGLWNEGLILYWSSILWLPYTEFNFNPLTTFFPVGYLSFLSYYPYIFQHCDFITWATSRPLYSYFSIPEIATMR